jgi:lambda repressor-like predicted transcriptional regulator
MSRLNVRIPQPREINHGGVAVKKISAEAQLTRLTLAHMLWENQFYIDGQSSADLMKALIAKAKPDFVEALAEEARTKFKLRHVPLFLARELARNGKLSANALNNVIQRPDEMSEFLSIYWKDGKTPLSNQVKKGLSSAFSKFNEYQLAKWDKNSAAVSLRDVMFLTHPKPVDQAQAILFKKIADQKLETPDTWETKLSAGADKKETFEGLMAERKLGALAFLRNLRNMVQAGINESMIREYAKNLDVTKVLPFRYIAAARIVPQVEDMLENMMFKSLATHEKLPGKTVLLVDVSGSMFGAKVSAKSDLDRFDAAAALAILCREICEEVEIYSFSDQCVRVQPRRGFALVEAIRNSQRVSGTDLGKAVNSINANTKYDRCIVFTDEQSQSRVSKPAGKGYVVNVAAYQNGINDADWMTISGFSEAIIDYIQLFEKL